ncbi:MAG: prolipoprotein diacylglyceryl transferase [Clostridia bacterium]|nr:prolipoprotein diacylglyceryl transferase [Clostridia bacterium]
MYPELHLFGGTVHIYDLMFFLGLVSVMIIYQCLANRFSYPRPRAAFYSIFTLVFGFLSAAMTAWIENGLLYAASDGAYDHFEKLRNYGIPMFLPLFWLLYCLLCREPFRKLTDYLAPSVYSVMTFVKIGCTFGGCCYGEADPNGIWNEELGYKTFPVQIYDALSSFVIVIICIVLIYTLAKKHKGYIYPIGGMLFAAAKGFWENFRVHSTPWEKNYLNTGWTFWQFWMSILFVCCFVWLVLTAVREKKGVPDYDEMQKLRFHHVDVEQTAKTLVKYLPIQPKKKKEPVAHEKKRRKK